MALATGIQRSSLVNLIARYLLRLMGWRTQVLAQPPARCVLIGAPHTSNWDFFFVLLLMAAEYIPIRWMGKDTLFRGPTGLLMRSLGTIPVNRRTNTNLVDQMAAQFEECDELILGIAPEGTRKKTTRWRTGFYYIALKARVPIYMAYIDYANKVTGIGPGFKPSGDIQADFVKIRDFYTGIAGKYPHKQGEIIPT